MRRALAGMAHADALRSCADTHLGQDSGDHHRVLGSGRAKTSPAPRHP
ncbi:hypothetical protein M8542_08880 [Amycolatopsis sp. OK19-0408]|uniref:Uncharacterized protein n=1 Tax=Amycolatopsis iheyensis TaxID=2945988 RepID=A0A9X2SHN9_9PSEU|nr:hypothetical protein [Amycolatopsis iheyensis]MCR6482932.1 hypothetical protein [Amycolatopsis iheyensis]